MPRRTILALAPLAFAAALWLAATFFYLGDTGKHSDDYWVAMRSMVTGEVDWSRHPWVRWRYFWRPLHLGHCSAINTISWHHPWIGHLELALVHGAVAWMLTRLIARLGVRREIAWVGGLLFMVCPLNAEAALWSSASCNAISSLFLLRALELVRRQGVGPATWWRDLWIGALAFITACWYEPAAAALAAVPLVFFAACGSERPKATRWRGVIRCTIAGALGCALYEGLLVATAPRYVRGGAASFVTVEKSVSRAVDVWRQVLDATVGGRGWSVIAGSIEQGWSVLWHTPAGIVFLLAVPLLAIATFISMRTSERATREESPAAAQAPARTGWLVLAGLAIYAGAWLPIIAIDGQRVELRTLYVPMLGVVFLLAALADRFAHGLAGAPATRGRAVQASALPIALAAMVAGAIGMIGFQSQFPQCPVIITHGRPEISSRAAGARFASCRCRGHVSTVSSRGVCAISTPSMNRCSYALIAYSRRRSSGIPGSATPSVWIVRSTRPGSNRAYTRAIPRAVRRFDPMSPVSIVASTPRIA